MLPPLLRVLLDDPGLLHAYATAYADLVREESGVLRRRLARRLAYAAGFAVCAFLALGLLGGAVMLYAVSGNGNWMLWMVPVVPLVAALILAAGVWRAPAHASFPKTRAQLDVDMQLIGLKESE